MGGWSLGDEPPSPRQQRASENSVRQIRFALQVIRESLSSGSPFELSVELICELHRIAMDGLVDNPGEPRTTDREDNKIRGSRHEPPPSRDVARHLSEMCAYCNDARHDAVHAAAYVLWRINWIHPFSPDGNGRTARVAALIVLFTRLGEEPVGHRDQLTLLELVAARRNEYYRALEAADDASKAGGLEVTELERILDEALTQSVIGATASSRSRS